MVIQRGEAGLLRSFTRCVVEDSESTKQNSTEWQPGSAQAQFGVNHLSWWGCQR
ncbi:MAG: hypothetical protein KME46_18215 [Brasilonema angustatum HA4187-MV1]|nr:hypothetical protein [Brasilonema angustatum HA4187-MV1]